MKRGHDSLRTPLCGLLAPSIWAFALGCSAATPPFHFPGPTPTNASDRAMARFTQRYLDTSLGLAPVTASSLGVRAKAFQKGLSQIERARLSTPFQIDHELIEERLKRERFALEQLDPLSSNVEMYDVMVRAAFTTLTSPPDDVAEWPDRLRALLRRMHDLPRFLEQAKENLRNPPRIVTEVAIRESHGRLEPFQSLLPKLFAPYPDLAGQFFAERPSTMAALRAFDAFLEFELLPRSNGDWRLGAERFDQALGIALSTSVSASKIYLEAESDLRLAQTEMQTEAFEIEPSPRRSGRPLQEYWATDTWAAGPSVAAAWAAATGHRFDSVKTRLRICIQAMIDVRLHTTPAKEEELDAWALDLMTGEAMTGDSSEEPGEAGKVLLRAKLSPTRFAATYVVHREMLAILRDAQKKAGPKPPTRPILEKIASYGLLPPRAIRRLMTQEGLL